MADYSAPIQLTFKKSTAARGSAALVLTDFSSYSFDRSILTPASAFRFTASGVDQEARNEIRSGDLVTLQAYSPSGELVTVATGIVDETDTHITADMLEYGITGRDLLGQLVDNSAVDASNQIINLNNTPLKNIVSVLLTNTRIPKQFVANQLPSAPLLFQTNAGETKISALQRYLDLVNCLIWNLPDGRVSVGKPNFTQESLGKLSLSYSDPSSNNILECRVKRNLNQAIRRIVTQLSSLQQVNAGAYTMQNADPDVREVAPGLVGRSVYRNFSYGASEEAANQITAVGNQNAMPNNIGNNYSAREIARENMKVLDIEIMVEGHFGPSGKLFNIDQVYSIYIEDEDVEEDMYCYSVEYQMTARGLTTSLHFCRLWTIVAFAGQLRRVGQ